MRPAGCAITLLLLTSCAQAQSARPQEPVDARNLQTGYCPQTRQLEAAPSQHFFLEGNIGKRHVRMYLDRGGASVVGLFFDLGADWAITLLGGTWNDGSIDATDATENHPATGQLTATLAGSRMEGQWLPAQSSNPQPVKLHVIPEPHCDGKESWKRYEDPDADASFSYPASWRVENTDDSLTLTCADPSAIAYDQHVVIYGGSGNPSGPTNLLRCSDTWIYGSQCKCTEKGTHACPVAKVSHTRSATVFDVSEHEWRVECLGGGYVGQGEGVDRVLLFGDRWLEITGPPEIVERLTRTVKPNKSKP